MRKIILAFIFIWAAALSLKGQNDAPQLKNVIPPSPTTASLGKYGEIPVGLYTGTPNISIPLYEINDGPLSLPISLSYHAAGIRVEEIASEVGLGWALNAGGVLGRQIRGNSDSTGWIKSPQSRIGTIIQSGNASNINAMSIQLEVGALDGEADIYYYNFNGRTGKFFYGEDGTLYNYPEENVSIKFSGGLSNLGFAGGWEIIEEDGTVYEFNATEHVYTSTCNGNSTENYMAWYLTKITSADGKRHIDLNYDPISYNFESSLGQKQYFPIMPTSVGCIEEYSNCTSNSFYTTNRLSRIDFSGGYVDFVYNTARQDLPGTNRLDEIKIYSSSSNGDKQVKGYQFGYGYFGPANGTPAQKRLKLVSVSENLPNVNKPPYLFTYEESIVMPTRGSFSKDHWGYYNGATNSGVSIPTFNYNDGGNSILIRGGADREANASTMQACILKKIKYPTGGETLFTYETNKSTDTRLAVTEFTESTYYIHLNELWSSLTSPYEAAITFTVPEGEGVEVDFSMTGLTESGSVYNCDAFQCQLYRNGNPTIYYGTNDGLNGATLELEPGTYKFRFDFDCYNPQGRLQYNIQATVRAPVVVDGNVVRHVGGLRIKQIEDKPGDGGKSVIKNYTYASDGILVNFPQYGYKWTVQEWDHVNGHPICAPIKECRYIAAAAATNYPLATTNGSYVGYHKVIEDLGDNGEIEHYYQTYTDPPAHYPFPPIEMFDWKKGKEYQTNYYSIENGERILRKEIQYIYGGFGIESINGYKTSRNLIYTGCASLSGNAPFITYNVSTEFYSLNKIIERNYDQNDPNKYVETSTSYKYDTEHFQQVEVVNSVSGSDDVTKDELVVKRKFPEDYNTASVSGSEALGIKNLNDLHVVNVPLEEFAFRRKVNTTNGQVSNERIVSGVITTFKPNDPYPDKILSLEKNNSMSLASFGTGSTISNNVFVKNANSTISNLYTPAVEFNSYDGYGNLTKQRKAHGTYTSYIWGYNDQYPIAKIENLDYSSIPVSTITSLKTKSNADNDRTRGTAGNEGILRTALNNLRTTFPQAIITTYTYDPLIGITSITDPTGYVVYYEYDASNRLKEIRDRDNNIVSKNEYHYKN